MTFSSTFPSPVLGSLPSTEDSHGACVQSTSRGRVSALPTSHTCSRDSWAVPEPQGARRLREGPIRPSWSLCPSTVPSHPLEVTVHVPSPLEGSPARSLF